MTEYTQQLLPPAQDPCRQASVIALGAAALFDRRAMTGAERSRKHRELNRPPVRDVPCKRCGQPFRTHKPRVAKYCSVECRDAWFREKSAEKRRSRLRTCPDCGLDRVKYRQRRCKECEDARRKATCNHCGREYMQQNPHRPQKYCSDECRVAERRARAPKYKCKSCGREFIKHGGSRILCRDCDVKRRLPMTQLCGYCGREFTRSDGMTRQYCGPICKDAASNQRQREKRKKAKSKRRNEAAHCLKALRRGESIKDIAITLGRSETNVLQRLAISKRYRAASKNRRRDSKWKKVEVRDAWRSSEYPHEDSFTLYLRGEWAERFDCVQPEAAVEAQPASGRGRRLDFLIEHNGLRFGVEAKVTRRTSRLDQCLGQAILKSHLVGAIPVCVVPDDINPDQAWIDACSAHAVIAGKAADVTRDMLKKCAILGPRRSDPLAQIGRAHV